MVPLIFNGPLAVCQSQGLLLSCPQSDSRSSSRVCFGSHALFPPPCSIPHHLETLLDYMSYVFSFYADDTQLYLLFETSPFDNMVSSKAKLEACVRDIDSWMLINKLKMNRDKTELLVLSSSYLPPPLFGTLTIASETLNCSSMAKNIGVVLDGSLSFVPHIMAVCKSSFCHLQNIAKS